MRRALRCTGKEINDNLVLGVFAHRHDALHKFVQQLAAVLRVEQEKRRNTQKQQRASHVRLYSEGSVERVGSVARPHKNISQK